MSHIITTNTKRIGRIIVTFDKLVLPFLNSSTGEVDSKIVLTILDEVDITDLNNFMQKRLKVKSKDCRSALPK